MKRLFSIILAILCLLTMLSIPAFAANAGVEPYGTPGSGYDQKNFTFNRSTYTAKLYLQFNSSYVAQSRCETVAETQIDYIGWRKIVYDCTENSGWNQYIF